MANKVVLDLDPSPRNARNSEGSFVTLKSGRLLLIYTKYGGNNADHGAADLVSRFSDDGGRTWSDTDRVVIKRDRAATNVMSVSLLRLADGRIMLIYLRKEDAGETCFPMICFSDDEARSFSTPKRITPHGGYYVVNNDRVIQLRDGRLVVPAAQHRQRLGYEPPGRFPGVPATTDSRHASGALCTFFLSDDGGAQWYESTSGYFESWTNGGGLQEPGVVELYDGALWSWARAHAENLRDSHGFQWESFSSDRGRNWLPSRPSVFRSPNAPMSVKRIPFTGDLLAVWVDHSGRWKLPKPKPSSWTRTPLVSAISKDDGRTWQHHRLLEKSPDHGYCYTAIHFTDDAVLLGYCAGGSSTRIVLDRLRVRRMTIDELYV
jgi:sialidase-1